MSPRLVYISCRRLTSVSLLLTLLTAYSVSFKPHTRQSSVTVNLLNRSKSKFEHITMVAIILPDNYG